MNIIIAKSAGFCFGVRRAVAICERAAVEHTDCVTLGPIIHNAHVIRDLEKKGVRAVADISEIKSGNTVIIRSHGAGRAEIAALDALGVTVIDATCPDVKKIHDIVSVESRDGRLPVIIGDREHPEVIAIAGWCDDAIKCEIFKSSDELSDWLKQGDNAQKPVSVVFQTTLTQTVYNSCVKIIKKECTNPKIFDTICNATFKRQQEAAEIAKTVDLMVVVGGKTSANSLRLADICREHCPRVVFTEDADGINAADISMSHTVGITAGASTPVWIIKEVSQTMMSDEMRNDEAREEQVQEVTQEPVTPEQTEAPTPELELSAAQSENDNASQGDSSENESFEEMLEKSIKTLHTGEKVTGIVTLITPTEVTVELGTKQSGYISASEFSNDPNAKIDELIKVGDEIDAFVMRVNDVEGMVMLSKKRLDAVKHWEDIAIACENKSIVEGTVTEENKGGVVVMVEGIRVFVPASQTGVPKDSPLTGLLKTKVRLRITEVNQSRRRVVGSMRSVIAEERREKSEQVWNDIEVGKEYEGVVKSMTSYGVFVDIGGVDGMVHISELSWTRIKQPSDIMAVGDKVLVRVLSFDKENRKISLGYRKDEDNPWTRFTTQYHVGDVVNVKIVKMMPFGAFAEICPGIDGLIHISQITDRRIGLPSEELSDGQMVDVKITEIDYDRKKISLSIRALMDSSAGPLTDHEIEAAEDRTPTVVYDTDAPPPSEEEIAEVYNMDTESVIEAEEAVARSDTDTAPPLVTEEENIEKLEESE